MLPKRLFIALDVPGSIREVLSGLAVPIPGVQWQPQDKLHLTVSFLGEAVPPDAQIRLREKIAAVRVPPFFLPIMGVGSFSRGNRPSVIWVGAGQGHPHLFALHKMVKDATLAADWPPELQGFTPHVTLGRCGPETPREMVRQFLKANQTFDAGSMKVEGFTLYSSFRGVYTPEMQVRWSD